MTNTAKTYNPLTNPNAVDMLRKHFPDFLCVLPISQVSFFHEITEAACGGDEVNPVPYAFAISNLENMECALFSRAGGILAFYGLFEVPVHAFEFLVSHFDKETYWGNLVSTENVISNLGESSPLDEDEDQLHLPTESVDN